MQTMYELVAYFTISSLPRIILMIVDMISGAVYIKPQSG